MATSSADQYSVPLIAFPQDEQEEGEMEKDASCVKRGISKSEKSELLGSHVGPNLARVARNLKFRPHARGIMGSPQEGAERFPLLPLLRLGRSATIPASLTAEMHKRWRRDL